MRGPRPGAPPSVHVPRAGDGASPAFWHGAQQGASSYSRLAASATGVGEGLQPPPRSLLNGYSVLQRYACLLRPAGGEAGQDKGRAA